MGLFVMPRLDQDTLDMILDTLDKYARRKLSSEYLLSLDQEDKFPQEVLDELYDPNQLGLHLTFIDECYGGLGGGAYELIQGFVAKR
jgi:alkylation response protein AidB-like acyl-CoA dehydrogenase